MKLFGASLYSSQSSTQLEGKPLSEMNTTPLIDVMLVLLVMLIITIPVQMHSLTLDSPSSSSAAAPVQIRLQLDPQGFVHWDGQRITDLKLLDEKLLLASAQNPQPEIHITPESNTSYAIIIAMLATAQKAGLQRVGIVQ